MEEISKLRLGLTSPRTAEESGTEPLSYAVPL